MADVTQPTRTIRTKYRFASPHGMLIALPISLALWALLLLAVQILG